MDNGGKIWKKYQNYWNILLKISSRWISDLLEYDYGTGKEVDGMRNIELLSDSLEYIENHLESDIRTEDVAKACHCSKSTLEKLFRCVNDITVRDYIMHRRMMKAARIIAEKPETGILEIALQYGYGSNESFTRAFKQVWNCKPSEFRKKVRFSELFPRLNRPLENGDEYMMERRHFDISELYDLFVKRRNCYIVCCDIKDLTPINEISRKAGDMAIIEAMKRMNQAAGIEDVVFRVGGDEFVMLTDSEDIHYANSVAEKIRKCNHKTFLYDTKEITLGLHVGITKVGESAVKYDELFTKIHTAILDSK